MFAENIQCSFLHPHRTTLSLLSYRGQLTLAPRSGVYSKPISLVQPCVINTLRWGGGAAVAFLLPSADHLVPGFLYSCVCHFYFSFPAPVRAPRPVQGHRTTLYLDWCYLFPVSGHNCLSIAVGLMEPDNPVTIVSLRDLASCSSSPFW